MKMNGKMKKVRLPTIENMVKEKLIRCWEKALEMPSETIAKEVLLAKRVAHSRHGWRGAGHLRAKLASNASDMGTSTREDQQKGKWDWVASRIEWGRTTGGTWSLKSRTNYPGNSGSRREFTTSSQLGILDATGEVAKTDFYAM